MDTSSCPSTAIEIIPSTATETYNNNVTSTATETNDNDNDNVPSIDKETGNIRSTATREPEVFAQAVSCKAWARAVQVLHNALLVGEFIVLNRIKLIASSHFYMAESYTNFLKPFVRQSKRGKMYTAGAVFAAWGKRWGLVQGLLKHLHQGPHSNANIILLRELTQNCKFQMVYSWLLKLSQQGPLRPDYVNVVLREAGVLCRRDDASTLVDWLMDKCEDRTLLEQVLYYIVTGCKPNLLRKFIAKHLLQQCRNLDFAFENAINMYMSTTSRYNDDTETQNCYHLVVTCIEAGFSCPINNISHKLYINTALSGSNKRLIQLLHLTGFLSFADLHHMLLLVDIEYCSLEERDKEELRKVLKDLTSSPRTLKNLCCIRLSSTIGCVVDRKERALALGLPLTVTNQILFQDELYS